MSEGTKTEPFMKRFWRKKSERTKEKVESDFPIDGTSFDQSSGKGMENSLSRKAINSEYFWQKFGYFGVTLISIAASVWGGWQLGTMLFILMAAAVELVKMILPSEARTARVLASTFSFVIGCFAFYMALQHGNAAAGNQDQNEKMLIASIESIDLQLKNLGSSSMIPVSTTSATSFDTDGYNKLIAEIATKDAELDQLKRDRHTYWQKRPNKRNRRTGAWMLANPDKCTGTYCPKLNAKAAHVKALKAQKKAMDKQKAQQMDVEQLALKAQRDATRMAQEREATKQGLMRTRNEYQAKLLNMNNNVVMEKPIKIIMFLVVTFLILIEFSQGSFKESSDILVGHRRRINMLHDNFLKRVKMKEDAMIEKQKTGGWFSRKKQPKVETKKKINSQFKKGTKLTVEIANEVKKELDSSTTSGNKYSRAKCFEVFHNFGVGQTNLNFKNFKTMMNI